MATFIYPIHSFRIGWNRFGFCESRFFATVGSALASMFALRELRILYGFITFLGATVLCVHQSSYNDMTFVTAWWTALWNLWFVFRMDDPDKHHLMRRAAFLSRLIVSIILFGGAAGKWTPEYWSGEVLYDIYFVDRDFWLFNILRENFQDETLQEMAMWHSRHVVIVETTAGLLLWLLPAKWAALVGVILLNGIALFSNFLLYSVLMSLVGLVAVGFLLPSKQSDVANE